MASPAEANDRVTYEAKRRKDADGKAKGFKATAPKKTKPEPEPESSD